MNASTFATRAHRAIAYLPALAGALTACAAPCVQAQQDSNPGNMIIERTITPRDAFDSVPKSQDPVAISATTFPASTFNPAMGSLVSDLDLTNAHGSSGVSTATAIGSEAGLQAVTKILSGTTTGSNVAMGPGGLPQQSVGIGGQISMSVTGALAPLGAALGGVK